VLREHLENRSSKRSQLERKNKKKCSRVKVEKEKAAIGKLAPGKKPEKGKNLTRELSATQGGNRAKRERKKEEGKNK